MTGAEAAATVQWREDPIEAADGLTYLRLGINKLIEEAAGRQNLSRQGALMYDAATTSLYYLGFRDEALRRFDQTFDLGVIARSERAKIENPGGLNDVHTLPSQHFAIGTLNHLGPSSFAIVTLAAVAANCEAGYPSARSRR